MLEGIMGRSVLKWGRNNQENTEDSAEGLIYSVPLGVER